MYVMTLHRTTIGKKFIMAVTGLIYVGYVLIHMYGNLKAFLGPAYFNEYAEGLRELGAPIFGHLHLLTIARIVLVVALVLHIWAAWSLTQQALRARPSRYIVRKSVQANAASLSMRWGGVALLLFIIYHLAHLTWGVPGVHSDFVRGDAYYNLVVGMRNPIAGAVYLAGVVALAFHLYHGVWSMFQTLGMSNEVTERPIRVLAVALALITPLGFAAVPVAIWVGMIGL
jgi:succinate dehydrogenase / fumarate reductase cytochrome b subunit